MQVYERTVYKIHQALANNIRFLPGGNEDLCVSAASDGFVKVFDLELGESSAQVCSRWAANGGVCTQSSHIIMCMCMCICHVLAHVHCLMAAVAGF